MLAILIMFIVVTVILSYIGLAIMFPGPMFAITSIAAMVAPMVAHWVTRG